MYMQGFLRHRNCSLKVKIGHYIVHLSVVQPRPVDILQNPNKCKAQVLRRLVKVTANCLSCLWVVVLLLPCVTQLVTFPSSPALTFCSSSAPSLGLLTLWPIPSSDKQHILAPIYSWLMSGFNTPSHYSTILLIIELFHENICLLLKTYPPIILSLLRPQLEKAATRYQNKATFEEHCRKHEDKLYIRIVTCASQAFSQEKVISPLWWSGCSRAQLLQPTQLSEPAGLNTSPPT